MTIQNRSLSDLPDRMLHHILSFLDTKSSVQTSVLSRRWISLWKYVHALTFSGCSFESASVFERYVDRVLSLRSDPSMVTSVTTDFGDKWSKNLLDRIMKYAASHGVQELYIRNLIAASTRGVFGSICVCYQSLNVLELERTNIEKTDVGLWSRFQLLEALTLTFCDFVFADGATDAFANFPRLETLKLVNCQKLPRDHDESETSVLKVTGLKLLHLEIISSFFHSLEIVAPKLQSFTLKIDKYSSGSTKTLLDVSKSNLPSLNRANIELSGNKPWFCVNLFKILHNVQALHLKVDTFQLLIQTCNLVKHQSSPFKKLTSLNVKCSEEGLPGIPNEVMQYFFGGSPRE
ncbi:F-box/LRR-repeat protein At3g58940 [Linum grandiflorum]